MLTTDPNGAPVRQVSSPTLASRGPRAREAGWWLVLASTLLACLLSTGPAWAAPSQVESQTSDSAPSAADLERARGFFQKGVELAKQRQFAAAEARFRDALAIHRAPAVEYNLAAALFELQQYDEAFTRCQAVLADQGSAAPLRERAEALLSSLYPRVARLTVITSSAAHDLTVRVDGEPLEPSALGVPRIVSAGNHTVLAQRAGLTVSQRSVDVPLGTAAIVDLSLIVAEQQTVQPDGPEGHDLATPPSDQRRRRLLLWGGIAAGVLAVGIAVGVGIALSKREPETQSAAAGDFQPGVLTWR